MAGGRIIGFLPFPRVLVLSEMQSVSSRIWSRVAVSISYDDNHYTTEIYIIGPYGIILGCYWKRFNFRCPPLCHIQVILCAIYPVCHLNYPHNCLSSQFFYLEFFIFVCPLSFFAHFFAYSSNPSIVVSTQILILESSIIILIFPRFLHQH